MKRVGRPEILLRAGAAAWGLAIAMALLPAWDRPAEPGQLASYATTAGLDARAPMRFALSMLLLPLVTSAIMQPLIRRMAAARPWAVNTIVASTVIALWSSTAINEWKWATIPTLGAIGIAFALRDRDVGISRHDTVLVPVLATAFLAVLDVWDAGPGKAIVVAAALVLLVRLGIAMLPSSVPPGLAFVMAPLGLLVMSGFAPPDIRHFGWPALAFVVVTPFLVRRSALTKVHLIRAVTLVIYPIVAFSYASSTSLMTAEGLPRVNFFEDAHHLIPASEMLRGEKPYADIVPVHGLGEDALFSYLPARLGDVTIGSVLRARHLVALGSAIAMYALGAAVTGSAHAGILTFFLASALGTTGTSTLRVLPALIALTFLALGVRQRNYRWFAPAAACTAVAVLTSLDFGAYTAVVLLLAVLRFRPHPTRALRFALIGGGIATLCAFAILGFFGIADDFVRTTLSELPAAATTGTLNIFGAPAALRATSHIPEVLAGSLDLTSYLFVLWPIVVIFAAVMIWRPSTRRFEPLLLLSAWTGVAVISYAQRHHLFFQFMIPPLLVATAVILYRRRSPMAKVVLLATLMLAHLTNHVAITSWLRRSTGPVDANLTVMTGVPRARGALFATRDAKAIAAARKYVDLSLKAHETFFDFSDRGILYFLLRRDCPIRQPVVVFYQPAELQREVIRRISDPRVAAVLVPNGPQHGMDGVGNQTRAPLVWQYIQANFAPDFSEDGVQFWRRR
ncbi:MAG: hypothetical protein ABIO78_02325 [Thermoanaerobaculia bacterium]